MAEAPPASTNEFNSLELPSVDQLVTIEIEKRQLTLTEGHIATKDEAQSVRQTILKEARDHFIRTAHTIQEKIDRKNRECLALQAEMAATEGKEKEGSLEAMKTLMRELKDLDREFTRVNDGAIGKYTLLAQGLQEDFRLRVLYVEAQT